MRTWTDDQLRHAVAASRNLSQTLVRLGLRPRGANYETVRRRLRELQIDTDHWPRARYRVVDPEAFAAAVAASDSVAAALRRIGWPSTTTTRRRFRGLVAVYGLDLSHFLGQASQRGKRFPERARPVGDYLCVKGLDHINGDRDDNRLQNLRLLCPNCHALTPTYRGRNVGRYPASTA